MLAGCVATPLVHPTKNDVQRDADWYDCEKDGWEYASRLGFHGNPLIAADKARECMHRKHGWRNAPPGTKAAHDKKLHHKTKTQAQWTYDTFDCLSRGNNTAILAHRCMIEVYGWEE